MIADPAELSTEHQVLHAPATVPPQLQEIEGVQGFKYAVTTRESVSIKQKWSCSEAFHKQKKKS